MFQSTCSSFKAWTILFIPLNIINSRSHTGGKCVIGHETNQVLTQECCLVYWRISLGHSVCTWKQLFQKQWRVHTLCKKLLERGLFEKAPDKVGKSPTDSRLKAQKTPMVSIVIISQLLLHYKYKVR